MRLNKLVTVNINKVIAKIKEELVDLIKTDGYP